MSGKINRWVMVAGIIAWLGMVSVSSATIVDLPLDCAGTYNTDNPGWQTTFDLGVEFTEITHVFIECAFALYESIICAQIRVYVQSLN